MNHLNFIEFITATFSHIQKDVRNILNPLHYPSQKSQTEYNSALVPQNYARNFHKLKAHRCKCCV